ncbi:MAG TPA: DUF4298 domain-containing protein [Anaerolineaceae bacterium]|nr:DUF4298 domain-containing protein [Anaerolineaceae bacterium]
MDKKTPATKKSSPSVKEKEQIEIVADDPAAEEELAIQHLYEQVLMDTKDIKRFLSFFRQANKRMQLLAEYYYSGIEEDLDSLEGLEEGEDVEQEIEVLGEDAVFDLMNEQYDLVQKMILAAAKYVNAGL